MTRIVDDLSRSGEADRRYQELRLRVEQRAAAVAALDDDALGDGRLGLPAVEQLVAATDELLAFEDRLPVLRDLPARAATVQVVRAAALAALLGGVLLALGTWRDILGGGWLVAVLIAVLAAARLVTLPVAPAAGRHRRQRYTAAVGGAAGLLVGPAAVVGGWLPGIVCLLVQLGCLAVLLELPKERA